MPFPTASFYRIKSTLVHYRTHTGTSYRTQPTVSSAGPAAPPPGQRASAGGRHDRGQYDERARDQTERKACHEERRAQDWYGTRDW